MIIELSMDRRNTEIDIAVVDVETTGFLNSDKIVEIAIVKIDRKCRITREYQTLINPRRDVGPTHVHHITASMVYDAPVFEEVARDILSLLPEKTMIVGHNVGFDLNFIERELSDALGRKIKYNSFCTMKEAKKLIPSRSYKLETLCQMLAIRNKLQHSAMGDAQATLSLFEILVRKIEEQTSVNLLSSFKDRPVPEADEMVMKVRCTGQNPLCKPFRIKEADSLFPASLTGKTVCFTGTSMALSEEGSRLSRKHMESCVRDGGMIVRGYVTKDLDMLIASDRNSLSGKARKARQYGVPVIGEREFWAETGLLVS